jgi:hypothetical protein
MRDSQPSSRWLGSKELVLLAASAKPLPSDSCRGVCSRRLPERMADRVGPRAGDA